MSNSNRDIVLSSGEDQVGRVPWLKPLLELFHAVNILVEVGSDFR